MGDDGSISKKSGTQILICDVLKNRLNSKNQYKKALNISAL
ncbi:hypothetical protein XCR1_90005 [Xenorhabdus cabanillasii JM26]|uniref:Uncharacterized protein n=1 Tax=Xenorhabdus cabanillasii JM26 TaxID=1427517 RepID=W1JBJ1_9GAMM|nr:hypothetical protein XCR1_90005 [Xenorhabdus cabanillasii JM26]